MTSTLIRAALDQIAALRAEHRLIIEADYADAEAATNGVMLNERGRMRGINPYALFTHNRTFFSAYASEELVEWRASHPHLSFEEYERQMTNPEPF